MNQLVECFIDCLVSLAEELLELVFTRAVRLTLLYTGCLFLKLFTLGYLPRKEDLDNEAAYIYWAGLFSLIILLWLTLFFC